jgi:hypothetical protein
MSEQFDSERTFLREFPRQDDPELDPVARRLEQERPTPRAAFRGELRRRLLQAADLRSARPQRLRFLIAAYAGSGTVLLAIAALGLAGAGPFAAS